MIVRTVPYTFVLVLFCLHVVIVSTLIAYLLFRVLQVSARFHVVLASSFPVFSDMSCFTCVVLVAALWYLGLLLLFHLNDILGFTVIA